MSSVSVCVSVRKIIWTFSYPPPPSLSRLLHRWNLLPIPCRWSRPILPRPCCPFTVNNCTAVTVTTALTPSPTFSSLGTCHGLQYEYRGADYDRKKSKKSKKKVVLKTSSETEDDTKKSDKEGRDNASACDTDRQETDGER